MGIVDVSNVMDGLLFFLELIGREVVGLVPINHGGVVFQSLCILLLIS